MSASILKSTDIATLPIKIQCSWANCFTLPEFNRGLCIRSYDLAFLRKSGSVDNIIGTLTGNYTMDIKGVYWLEANLLYADRRNIGWFRQRDIWFTVKEIVVLPPPETPYTPGGDVNPATNKSWLAWIAAGLGLLSVFH